MSQLQESRTTEHLEAEPFSNHIFTWEAHVDYRKGLFPVETTIGPDVLMVTGINFASRMLEASCCDVCKIFPIWIADKVGMPYISSVVKIEMSYNKFVFSSMENTFWVYCKLVEPTSRIQHTQSLWQLSRSLTIIILERPKWKIVKHWFPVETTIEPGVLSLRVIYFRCRKL